MNRPRQSSFSSSTVFSKALETFPKRNNVSETDHTKVLTKRDKHLNQLTDLFANSFLHSSRFAFLYENKSKPQLTRLKWYFKTQLRYAFVSKLCKIIGYIGEDGKVKGVCLIDWIGEFTDGFDDKLASGFYSNYTQALKSTKHIDDEDSFSSPNPNINQTQTQKHRNSINRLSSMMNSALHPRVNSPTTQTEDANIKLVLMKSMMKGVFLAGYHSLNNLSEMFTAFDKIQKEDHISNSWRIVLVAVDKSSQHRHYASHLLKHVYKAQQQLQILTKQPIGVYSVLCTEEEVAFFQRQGFEKISRRETPKFTLTSVIRPCLQFTAKSSSDHSLPQLPNEYFERENTNNYNVPETGSPQPTTLALSNLNLGVPLPLPSRPLAGSESGIEAARPLITPRSSYSALDLSGVRYGWEVKLSELSFGKTLGSGAAGVVYKGVWRGLDVAIKKLRTKGNPSSDSSFLKEIDMMSQLRHPNVIQFLGACLEPGNFCLITEYMPEGNLHQVLNSVPLSPKITWKMKLRMAKEITQGLNYLHLCEPPIIHRDLKSLNTLVDSDLHVKIADFGLSKSLRTELDFQNSQLGTVGWVAPELFSSGECTPSSDIYALGTIFWEILTNKYPYGKLTVYMIMRKIEEGYKLEIPEGTDLKYAELIRRCMDLTPQNRPIAKEVLSNLVTLYNSSPSVIISVPPPVNPIKDSKKTGK